MKPTLVRNSILAALLFGLGACTTVETANQPQDTASPMVDEGDGATKTDDDGKQEKDLAGLQEKASMAQARVELAHMEFVILEQKQAFQLAQAEVEVELAKAKLANFDEVEGPNSLAQEKLNFQSAKESAEEAAEELAQIKIMYDEQDLNDMTREYVIARGKRRADRAEARIAIQASKLQAFEAYDLPVKRRRIELEVEKAVQGLEQTKLEQEVARKNKELSIREAESKLKRAQEDLEEAASEDAK